MKDELSDNKSVGLRNIEDLHELVDISLLLGEHVLLGLEENSRLGLTGDTPSIRESGASFVRLGLTKDDRLTWLRGDHAFGSFLRTLTGFGLGFLGHGRFSLSNSVLKFLGLLSLPEVGFEVLDPLIEDPLALLHHLVARFVFVIVNHGEHAVGTLLRGLDLEEWVLVWDSGFTLGAEIEVWQDRALVAVADDGVDIASVAGNILMDSEVRGLGHLDPLHGGKLTGDVRLVDVENLGNLTSDLRNSLGNGIVDLLFDL